MSAPQYSLSDDATYFIATLNNAQPPTYKYIPWCLETHWTNLHRDVNFQETADRAPLGPFIFAMFKVAEKLSRQTRHIWAIYATQGRIQLKRTRR